MNFAGNRGRRLAMENYLDYFYYNGDFWETSLNKENDKFEVLTKNNSPYGLNKWDCHQFVIDGLIVYGRKNEMNSLFVAGNNHDLYEKINNIK